MKYGIYKLQFNTGLHMGLGNLETHSLKIFADVLYSAVINESALTGKELLQRMLKHFEKDIYLTDGFPYMGAEYFLPKPFLQFESNRGDSVEKKLYKKIEYIPLSMWEDYVNGKADPEKILKISKSIGNEQTDPKIKRDLEGDHKIFQVKQFRFMDGCGMYFIAGFESEEAQEDFEEVLKALSYSGIGGKRSQGLGKFDLIKEELPPQLKDRVGRDRGELLLTTSMAREDEMEQVLVNARYSLVKRSGFIFSADEEGRTAQTFKKRPMNFFNSGSIFENRFTGDIYRVDTDFVHPVYRYGKPLWLEVKR